MNIVISAESTIDMPQELLNKFNIKTTPFTIIMGDKEYIDGQIKNTDIFNFVEQNNILPKTSAVNEYQYKTHFDNLLKEYDAVIHISLSSEISCAYKNAKNVSQNYNNVHVIDSKSLSTGIALLAINAQEMVLSKKPLSEIVEYIEFLTQKIQASFVLDKLNYLHKGGRCGGLTVLGANLLRIKPQIVLNNGKMSVGKKYMGNYEAVVQKYATDVINNNSAQKDHVFITYTTASDKNINFIENLLKEKGFKNIYKTCAGLTITSHCGPNTLGVLFIKQ